MTEKHRLAALARWADPEYVKKMSVKRKPMSPEHKQRIGDAVRGQKRTAEQRENIRVATIASIEARGSWNEWKVGAKITNGKRQGICDAGKANMSAAQQARRARERAAKTTDDVHLHDVMFG